MGDLFRISVVAVFRVLCGLSLRQGVEKLRRCLVLQMLLPIM
jgi:hypothetical protein